MLVAGSEWPLASRLLFVGFVGAVLLVGLTEGLRWVSHEAAAQSATPSIPAPSPQPAPQIQSALPPHDNTFVGTVPPGLAAGSDNTVVNDADQNGNVIHSKTEAIGSHACAQDGSIAIGSHANAGSCQQSGNGK
jgi:hypothetical protein